MHGHHCTKERKLQSKTTWVKFIYGMLLVMLPKQYCCRQTTAMKQLFSYSFFPQYPFMQIITALIELLNSKTLCKVFNILCVRLFSQSIS